MNSQNYKMTKLKTKKSSVFTLSDEGLKNFIKTLRIDPEQEKVLVDELPKMDTTERLELLKALTDVYILNQQQDEAVARLQANWQ